MRKLINTTLGLLVTLNVIGCGPVAKTDLTGQMSPAPVAVAAGDAASIGGAASAVSTAVMTRLPEVAGKTAGWKTTGQSGVVAVVEPQPLPAPPVVEAPPVVAAAPVLTPTAQSPVTPAAGPVAPPTDLASLAATVTKIKSGGLNLGGIYGPADSSSKLSAFGGGGGFGRY